jgi:phage terminase large subunit-like protein
VLEDASLRGSPEQTARRAVAAFHVHHADRVVIERNNGGDFLPAVFRSVDPSVPTRTVWATRGKALRAEPVSALYEQGRVHHVGAFSELEDQMCQWAPGDPESPDRLDALVWAVTDLLVTSSQTEAYFTALAPPCVDCGIPVREGSEHRCTPAPARDAGLSLVTRQI